MTDTIAPPTRWDGRAYASAQDILDRAGQLGPLVAAEADEMERRQQLTEPVKQALVDAGVFAIGYPAEWGGPQMRVDDQIRLIEQLARFDGSVGWNVTIMADSGLYAGRLGRELAAQIYPSMDMPTAGSFNPPGVAEPVDGGYRLSGRWRFGTGIRNADRVLGRFRRHVDGQPAFDANGDPDLWVAWFPGEAVVRHDTWHTTGLAGSGSCDYSIDGVVVAADQMYRYADQFRPSLELPPLSRYYGTLTGNQVGVPLGIAAHGLDLVREHLAAARTKWGDSVSADQYVQVKLAEADGLYRAARAYALDTFADITDALLRDVALTRQQEANMQTAPVIACDLCRRSLEIVLDLVGAQSILRSKPYDRLYRDMSSLARHFYFRPIHLELSGRHLLGEDIPLSLSD